MGVAKFSVSFDQDLGTAIRDAAEDDDETVSAWLAEAARRRLRNLVLERFLDETIAELGYTDDELEAAGREARARSIRVNRPASGSEGAG
jgi:hypothetical protein